MKNTILLIALFCMSYYGFSQDTKYGVRAGINISNIGFEDAPFDGNDHRNGFMIGFFGEYGLSKTVSIMPELQFSAEGAKRESLRLDYLQVPVLIKFKLGDKFSIGAGPQVGVKVHKHSDGINNFAYSGLAGLEYKISHSLFVDARYTYGFRNIFDEDLIDAEAKNTNIQFGFGFKF